MQFDEFVRIVTCFADRVDDVDTSRGELLLQVRDEIIDAKLLQRPEGLIVEENDNRAPAVTWIVQRLARVSLLADRICSYVEPPEHFVAPSGRFLAQLNENPTDDESDRENVAATMTEILDHRPGGTTSVLYLTSDAGEGKTSLINQIAVRQAHAYKAKKSDWLLVPVPLGGRTFLRFDDVVVSALVNRLRYPLLYYDAFLELVRLGVLVPAFDGFEEMIVEASSGEALSALGGLVGRLRSAGTLLVAARKAYFDYPNFGSQARLFDTIGTENDVAFGRLSLERWDRRTFTDYARKRRVENPRRLFDVVSARLGVEHPVLTRAVLVRRLVDVAAEEASLTALLDRIGQDQRDYFHDFVGGIVEREARIKWTDRSGESSGALLATEEHHELLSMIAQEMWWGATDELGIDIVSLVIEVFAEEKSKSPSAVRQIQERIKQHALLTVTAVGRTALVFDHEDFRVFYLGQALGRGLAGSDTSTVRATVDKASLPALAVTEAVGVIRRLGTEAIERTIGVLQELADSVLPASFIRENCGVLSLALLDGAAGPNMLRNMSFPAGALRERRLGNVTVSGSYFHRSALAKAELSGCRFVNCTFERLELDGTAQLADTSLEQCTVDSVVRSGGINGDEIAWFDPEQVRRELQRAGFTWISDGEGTDVIGAEDRIDADLILAQRFLRAFLRSTALNESTIRQRLGVKANHFLKFLLPQLVRAGVVQDVQYQGHGTQRRLRLIAPMTRIEEAIGAAGGDFGSFVEEVRVDRS